MKESEVMARAARAKQFIESDIWQEAWGTYREKIIELMEKADSSDTDTVMHLKRLMASATAAQKHLETLMVDGKVAAKQLEVLNRKPFLKRLVS